MVNLVTYDYNDGCFVDDDNCSFCEDCILLVDSPSDLDNLAVEIACVNMKHRISKKREDKYPNSGWATCTKEQLKDFAQEKLNEGKLLDAMNYLAFAVALGYDYSI